MSPTPLTASAMAIVALLAFVLPHEVTVALFGVVIVALLVDAWFARAPVRISRQISPVAARAVPVELTIEVDDPRPRKIRVRQPRVPDLHFEPGEADGGLATMLTAERRGHHVVPPAIARRTGPLGLARVERAASRTEPTGLTVFPDVLAARRLATSVRRGRFRDAGQATRGALGLGTDFEAIRDYQPDDDVRQINWPATQRMQRPMSNQYRIEQDRDIVCLVDTGRLMCAPVDGRTRLDVTVDVVAAVAAVADELGDRCGVIAFDREIRRNVTTRRRGADAVVRAVHDLEPRLIDTDFELAFRSVRNTKRALIVVLTDLLDHSAARSLLDAAPVLVRRHAMIVASVSDADIELAAQSPDTAFGQESETSERQIRLRAWTQVVAERVLDQRRQVAVRLRQLGVQVIEAGPNTLPEACVRSYLQLKSKARL